MDAWVPASWEDYLQTIADPTYEKAKGYYYQGHMRIETAAVGYDHAADHTVMIIAVGLFGIFKGVPLRGLDTYSFRKAGVQEFQPDVSYYIGERAQSVPPGTNVVNLDLGNVLDMGMGCPESLVGLNPAIQIPMSSALPSICILFPIS